MSRKPTPDAMVKGMIMGANFLRQLIDRVVEEGGHPEMIHFLTTDRGEGTLEKVAKLIAKSKWQIPRSLMEKLTIEYGRECGEFQATDIYHWWARILDGDPYHLGVPLLRFDHKENRELDDAKPCSQKLIDQLRGKIREEDVIDVVLDGEEYIVAQIGVECESEIGKPFFTHDWELLFVDLVPLRFFDLTR